MTQNKDERSVFSSNLDINTTGEHFCIITDEGSEFSVIPFRTKSVDMVSLFMTDGTNMVSYELPKIEMIHLLRKLTKTVN